MRKQRKDAVDLDPILLLDVNPDMKVSDLQEIAERNAIYKRYFTSSKLTVEGWVHAMTISKERHYAYMGLHTAAPNVILNKSREVCRRVKRCLNSLNTMGI